MTRAASTTKKAPAKRAPVKRSPRAAKPAPAPEVVEDQDVDVPDDLADLEVDGEDTDPGPIGPDGTIRPVQIGKRGRAGSKMVTIFELDGVDYQVPEQLSVAQIIKFQKGLRRRGRDRAIWDLMVDLLGQDALDALADSPDVSTEDVADVFAIIAHLAFGALAKLREASDPS